MSEKCESYGIRGETFRQLLAEIQPTCSNERSRACLCNTVLDSKNFMGLFCIIRFDQRYCIFSAASAWKALMSSSPASIGADSDVPFVKSNESLYVVSSRAIKPSSSGSSYCLTIVTSCWFFMIRSISSASFSFTFCFSTCVCVPLPSITASNEKYQVFSSFSSVYEYEEE